MRRFLTRLVQKLVKAAQMSFAKGILQQHHIQFLMKINNEAKVRRSTRPVVLGTAVVMGHEELKAARAKRDEQDAAKEAKGKAKRGRKRKNAPEAEDDETELPKPKAKRAKKSKGSKEEAGISEVCEPVSVPVAQMY
ncbi:hypothetical protein DM02DRAFT_663601 [Periconia macrospinosa]|uniref:Uncharacterized protein n=1 Tax=Periconia macrospinosa TaxID=97972 RepID=A0A2V1D186_9PLEO|nr:hypothetical protein DM02DRAFT_663601 [Periconia macrospinosa]